MSRNRTIITHAPLRATTVGGGTDLPSFYKAYGPGAAVPFAIDKYVTIFVSKSFFPDRIRVSYSKTEQVNKVDEIEHPTVREALRLLNIEGGVEILSHSDIPSKGTGLGSSSTFLVALLHALHAWNGDAVSQSELAAQAVKIARGTLKEPGGQQDEYAAAHGGINLMHFKSDGSVAVDPIIMKEEYRKDFENHLMLLYTGIQRSAAPILKAQQDSTADHVDTYKEMRDLAYKARDALSKGDIGQLGAHMHRNWVLKKTLEKQISNSAIDRTYELALKNGALGGKIIGAGGGGFLLLLAPPDRHKKLGVEMAKMGLTQQKISIDYSGSRVIFVGQQKS
jgi:D-glycero-alpha-D-manno-heptose-7-phosphate kinase